ncbi:MAG: hypothetical protein ACREPL_12370 [Rhodanobacteraceae bacterium]
MNVQKLIAIVVAIAINCTVLAWLHGWSPASVASAAPPPVRAQQIITLPTITVRPSAGQLRELQRERAASVPEQASVAEDAGLMPYYSFAAQSSEGNQGWSVDAREFRFGNNAAERVMFLNPLPRTASRPGERAG